MFWGCLDVCAELAEDLHEQSGGEDVGVSGRGGQRDSRAAIVAQRCRLEQVGEGFLNRLRFHPRGEDIEDRFLGVALDRRDVGRCATARGHKPEIIDVAARAARRREEQHGIGQTGRRNTGPLPSESCVRAVGQRRLVFENYVAVVWPGGGKIAGAGGDARFIIRGETDKYLVSGAPGLVLGMPPPCVRAERREQLRDDAEVSRGPLVDHETRLSDGLIDSEGRAIFDADFARRAIHVDALDRRPRLRRNELSCGLGISGATEQSAAVGEHRDDDSDHSEQNNAGKAANFVRHIHSKKRGVLGGIEVGAAVRRPSWLGLSQWRARRNWP